MMLSRRSLILGALAAPAIIGRAQAQRFRGDPRRSIPGVPQIDWSHPLAQNLLFYGYDTGQGEVVDLVSGAIGSRVGTAAPNAPNPFGQGINYNNSETVFFPSSAAVRSTSLAFSWACAVIRQGSPAANACAFGRTANNNGSNPFINWMFFEGGTSNAMLAAIAISGPSNEDFGTGVVLSDNVWHSLCASFSVPAQAYYVDGSLNFSSTSEAGFVGVNTNDDICFSGASSAASAAPYIGFVPYGAFWARALPEQQAYQLHVDPYCFLMGDALGRASGHDAL